MQKCLMTVNDEMSVLGAENKLSMCVLLCGRGHWNRGNAMALLVGANTP